MKTSTKTLAKALVAVVGLSLTLTSCSDEPQATHSLNFGSIREFTSEGYWTKAYEPVDVTLSDNFILGHNGGYSEWDGVRYYYWKGFCPSRSTDRQDWTGKGDWIEHQWASVTPFANDIYMIGCWAVEEDQPSPAGLCSISRNGEEFTPESMTVTNTAYGYYAMKNGTAFNHAFGPEDWCKLTVTGYNDNVLTGQTNVMLADKGLILDSVVKVDLLGLGTVDKIVFTMSSSDSGQWGMNTPAYFALGDLTVIE